MLTNEKKIKIIFLTGLKKARKALGIIIIISYLVERIWRSDYNIITCNKLFTNGCRSPEQAISELIGDPLCLMHFERCGLPISLMVIVELPFRY